MLGEGAPAPVAVVVLSGQVELTRAGFLVDRCESGEVARASHLFAEGPSQVAITASAPARLVLVDAFAYTALREAGHPLASRLERLALRELAASLQAVSGELGRLAGDLSFLDERTPPPRVLGAVLDRALESERGEPSLRPAVEPAEILARSGLFADEPAARLAALGARLRRVDFARGDFLATQGERSQAMLFLASGSMEVLVADEPRDHIHGLGRMGPGSVLGLGSLVGDCPARASCIAAEDGQALVLDRWTFESLRRSDDPVGSTLRHAVLRRVSRQIARARATARAHRLQPRPAELLRAGVAVDLGEDERLAS